MSLTGDHKSIEQLRARLTRGEPLHDFLADLCESTVLRSSSNSERYSDAIGGGLDQAAVDALIAATSQLAWEGLDFVGRDAEYDEIEEGIINNSLPVTTSMTNMLSIEVPSAGTYAAEVFLDFVNANGATRTVSIDGMGGSIAGNNTLFGNTYLDSRFYLRGIWNRLAPPSFAVTNTGLVETSGNLASSNTMTINAASGQGTIQLIGLLVVSETMFTALTNLAVGIRALASGADITLNEGSYFKLTKLR